MAEFNIRQMQEDGYSNEEIASSIAAHKGVDYGKMKKDGYTAEDFLTSLHAPKNADFDTGSAIGAGASGLSEGVLGTLGLPGDAASAMRKGPITGDHFTQDQPTQQLMNMLPGSKELIDRFSHKHEPQNVPEQYIKQAMIGTGSMIPTGVKGAAGGALMGAAGEGATQFMGDPVAGPNEKYRAIGEAGMGLGPAGLKFGTAASLRGLNSYIPPWLTRRITDWFFHHEPDLNAVVGKQADSVRKVAQSLTVQNQAHQADTSPAKSPDSDTLAAIVDYLKKSNLRGTLTADAVKRLRETPFLGKMIP